MIKLEGEEMKRNWISFHRKMHSVGLSSWCCNEKREKNTKKHKINEDEEQKSYVKKFLFFTTELFSFWEMKWWRGPQERRGGGNSLVSTNNAKHSDLEFGFDLSLELRLDLSCLKQGNAFMLRIQIGECISHFGFWQQIFVSFCFAIFYSIFIWS